MVILVYYIHIFSALLRSYDYSEFTFAIAGLPAYLPMFSLPKENIFQNSKTATRLARLMKGPSACESIEAVPSRTNLSIGEIFSSVSLK